MTPLNLRKIVPVAVYVLLALVSLAACTRLGVPEGWPTAAVVGDTLYTGTMDGDVRALDAGTGELLWKFALRGEEVDPAIYGAPAIGDELLYVGGYDGFLYALTLADGLEVWNTSVGGSKPIVGGPVVADGLVLVGSSDGNLYAFDAAEGFFHWAFQTGAAVWSTPSVSDGVAYFGSLDHNVYAVDLRDGTKLWSFQAHGAVTASPVVARGRVYVGSFASVFFALDARTGKEVWRFDGADKWYWGGAVADESTIYAPSLDGNVYALDVDTGDLKWTLQTEGQIIGSPVVVSGRLAVPSTDERVRLVRLSDGLDERQYHVGSALKASLAAEGNILYVAAIDHSIRALKVTEIGGTTEKWVHETGE